MSDEVPNGDPAADANDPPSPRSCVARLFRLAAIEGHAAATTRAPPLRVTPWWVEVAFWSIVATFATGIAFLVVGSVDEYASGPAVVRLEDRNEVTVRADGTVSAVRVLPGQRVAAGAVLVQLDDSDRRAELEAATREFEMQLVNVLRDPADASALQPLAALRARRELAEARLGDRRVVAPVGGVVSDVRIRAGQRLRAGDTALCVIGDEARFSVVAFLPGSYRPLLRPGMPMRIEMQGFQYAYRGLMIESLGNEVVGAAEVGRFLGQEARDAVPVNGAVILVKATLPASTFDAAGQRLQYFDGMVGRADVAVRTEPLILSLVPGLRALLDG